LFKFGRRGGELERGERVGVGGTKKERFEETRMEQQTSEIVV